MSDPITMSSPDLDESDVRAVVEVLRSGRLALGPKAVEFERSMAEYVGVRHAVAVSSGTAALHVIVKALGIGPGDDVLVPSFTFAASVNAILYEGGCPVFVDIEEETFNLDPADLERRITPRTKAAMVVDVFGHPADWDALHRIAAARGLILIDDCCEALGAEYRGSRLGSFGRAGAFAFYPNKQITTGEGGVIVTNDDEIARLSRSLRNQGRGEMGAWLQHERLGYNYRLDEMSAALGVSQLARVESSIEKRSRVAAMYTERLGHLPYVRVPKVLPHVRMSWFVYVITLEPGIHRDPVMAAMERRGIPVRGYFTPTHLQPYIRGECGMEPTTLPVTESVARRTIALPFHNNLAAADIDRVVEALQEAVAGARQPR